MQIEIEKKYNLTDEDYKNIKEKTKFIAEINLKDYYLDKNLILAKNNYYLRLRNGIYELKISKLSKQKGINSCEEYNNEDKINEKIKQFGITTDDVVGICFIDTFREKYEYIFRGQKITIDIDKYQYGKRYEIEIVYESKENNEEREINEEKINNLIEDFRKEVGLTAESNNESYKIINCAMYQNIELYEIVSK